MKTEFLKSAILVFVAMTIVSCSKSDEEVQSSIDQIQANFIGVPEMTSEVLNSFRTFETIDELNLSDFSGRINPPPTTYNIPSFPEPHANGQNKNSCLLWSNVYYMMSYYKKTKLSPDFAFYSMVNSGKTTCDTKGTSIDDVRDFLIQNGSCKLSNYPAINYNCGTSLAITQQMENEAKNYKISDILRLKEWNITDSKNLVKNLISNNVPVGITIAIDKGFRNGLALPLFPYKYNSKFEGWFGGNNEKNKSYHAVTIMGYDDSQNAFKVVNSWGNSWGNQGYFWLDYQYINEVIGICYIIKPKDVFDNSNPKFYSNYNNNILIGSVSGSDFGGVATGVAIENYSGLNLYKFSKENHSRIEYNLNNSISGAPDQIPSQGTFEISMYINDSYQYSNYILTEDIDNVTILTTDNTGLDTHYPGSMRLIANKNGTIDFYINTTKYSSSPPDHLQAINTNFAYNKWNRIGVSYGSQGMYISINGIVVASDTSKTRNITNGGNQSLQNDRPTIGEAKSYFPWGNLQWSRGFNGYVYKVRTSDIQQDFKLSL